MSKILAKYTSAYQKLVPGESCREPMGVDAFLRGAHDGLRPCKRIEKDGEHLVSVIWMIEPPSEDRPLTKDRVIAVCCYSAPTLRKTLFGKGYELEMRSFAPIVMNKLRRAVKAITAAAYKQGSEAQQATVGKLKREFDTLAKQLLEASIPRAEFHERLMALLDELLSKFPDETEQALFGQVTSKKLSPMLPAPAQVRKAIQERIAKGGYPAIHVAGEPTYERFMELQRENVDYYVAQGLITLPPEDDAIKNACLSAKMLQPHQQFVPLYLGVPESPYNGLVLFWNTGAGKTTGAWSLLRQYRDIEGWNCFWATKSSLVTDPLKDYRTFYDPTDTPPSPQSSIVSKHNFYIMSWKVFENSFVRTGNHRDSWRIDCAERAGDQGNGYFNEIWARNAKKYGHPFARSVIVIDEAQYMYEFDASLTTAERPTASCLEAMIFQAYAEIEDPLNYPKILLLSATPGAEVAYPFLDLCNLLIADPNRRFFPQGVPRDNTFPAQFARKYLNADGGFTQEFRETIKGLVSCYDGRGNVERFAETLRVRIAPESALSAVGAASKQQQERVNRSASAEQILHLAAFLRENRAPPAVLETPVNRAPVAIADAKTLARAKQEYWDANEVLEVPGTGFQYDFDNPCFTKCDSGSKRRARYEQMCEGTPTSKSRWIVYTNALLQLNNDPKASEAIKAELAVLNKRARDMKLGLPKYLDKFKDRLVGNKKNKSKEALKVGIKQLNEMTDRWCALFQDNPIEEGEGECKSKERCLPSCASDYAKQLEGDPAFVERFFAGVDPKQRALAIRERISSSKEGLEDACKYLGVKLTAAIFAGVNAEELYNAPKLIALRRNIVAANRSDEAKSGHRYKHYLFSSVPFAPGMIGAALQSLAATAEGEMWDWYALLVEAKSKEDAAKVTKLVHMPSGVTLAWIQPGGGRAKRASLGIQFNPKFLEEVQEKINRGPKNGLLILDKNLPGQKDALEDSAKGKELALAAFNLRSNKAPSGICKDPYKVPYGNNHGELIQYAIVSKDYREGIDLFDVKYVHLFEPLPAEGRELQAIGRALRNCGQCGLKFDAGWRLYVLTYGVVGSGGEILEERAKLFLENRDSIETIELLEGAYYEYAVTNAMQKCQRFVPKVISKLPWEGGEQEVAREAPSEGEMQQVKEAPELAAAAVERAYAAQEARERERLAGVLRAWQAQKDAYRERISAQAKLFNEAYKAKQREVLAAIPAAVIGN